MRWDEIIDPRLRAYRRGSLISPTAARRAWSFPTPHDDPWPDPPYEGTSVLDPLKAVEVSMGLTDEAIEKICHSLGVPVSIVGTEPGVPLPP